MTGAVAAAVVLIIVVVVVWDDVGTASDSIEAEVYNWVDDKEATLSGKTVMAAPRRSCFFSWWTRPRSTSLRLLVCKFHQQSPIDRSFLVACMLNVDDENRCALEDALLSMRNIYDGHRSSTAAVSCFSWWSRICKGLQCVSESQNEIVSKANAWNVLLV